MRKNIILSAICATSAILSAQATSPYISKVYEYSPAPGQFINTIPEYESGDTPATILQKVSENICGDENSVVTLGGYGGYIVFGFDHTIVNVAGEYDFKILGNTFANSAEPGIIMVSRDTNGDGLPNDEWYEIAGSEHSNPATIHNYTITYTKPTSSTANVPWTASNGESGVIKRNIFHKQPYFPEWETNSTITFTGTKLPNNAVLDNGVYKLKSFAWGYADNFPNTDDNSNIKIDWAVNADNSPANLYGIDFVKVYTGVNQQCGDIGETSTEIAGAEDLHPNASTSIIEGDTKGISLRSTMVSQELTISSTLTNPVNATIYSTSGVKCGDFTISSGDNAFNISHLSKGIYIMQCNSFSTKFIKY